MLEPLLPYTVYLALLLRVWLGANYVIHGYPKVKSVQPSVQFMKKVGYPASFAYATALLEFFGGILLIIGLIVPIVALLYVVQMAAISVMKKTKMKAAYISPGGASYEIDVLYLMLAIVLMVLGAGPFSLDSLMGL